MESIHQVVAKLGPDVALTWADHRIETLEGEIRSNLQALRALSEAVLSGDPRAAPIAQAVKNLLEVKQAR
jgi:hypothetical protein